VEFRRLIKSLTDEQQRSVMTDILDGTPTAAQEAVSGQ
jgi:hypothetical protein